MASGPPLLVAKRHSVGRYCVGDVAGERQRRAAPKPSKAAGLTEYVARNATSDRKLLCLLPAPLASLLRVLLLALLERRGAPPGWCLGLEVVLPQVLGDLLAQHGSLHVGGAEVDAAPHARADDLLEGLREAVEAPRRAGCGTALVADRGERDLVGAEEGLQRVHEGTADAGVPRRVVREAGGDERRSGDGNRRVEERQPGRVGLGRRVAVASGLADRGDRAPEVPVVLVVPAADRAVGPGQVRHREQAGALDAVQLLALRQRAEDAVPDRDAAVLPEDRGCRLVGGAARARKRAELLDLVEVLRVGGAGERVRAVGAEHLHARDEERVHVPYAGAGVAPEVGRRLPPLSGIGAFDDRERVKASVVGARGEHRRGGGGPRRDAVLLVNVLGNRREG